ncbi:MAG TPA: hypothetical protein VHR85_03235 [Nocardioides sp.]|jgi:hypothetical protein|nr:hypothetical protein [Nocardioides sp.]
MGSITPTSEGIVSTRPSIQGASTQNTSTQNTTSQNTSSQSTASRAAEIAGSSSLARPDHTPHEEQP